MYNRYCPSQGYSPVEPEGGSAPKQPPGGRSSSSLLGRLEALLGGTKNAGVTGIFDHLGLSLPDRGDLLLLLVLFYLFRESEDEEWLILLALILLLGLGKDEAG